MTGSLEKGARLGIRHYNSMLAHLEETGAVPEDLFHRLDENDTTFDELSVACSLLESYLGDDEESHLLTKTAVNAPLTRDSQEVHELRELSEILRERLPELRQLRRDL